MATTDIGYANRQLNAVRKELSAAKEQIAELSYLVSFQRQLIAQDQELLRSKDKIITEYEDGLAQMKRDCFQGDGTVNIWDIDALQETIEDLRR